MSLLAERFREKVSKLKDHRMKSESEFEVGYPTGFLNFDFKNGAVVHVRKNGQIANKYYSVGLVDGSINFIIGRSGSGKTTFAVQSAANIIRPFPTACMFIDSIEGGITTTRLETLTGFYGDELSNRVIARNTGVTAENFYERIKNIYDEKMANRGDYLYNTGFFTSMGEPIYKLTPTVYILDSLSMLMPEQFTEEEQLSGQMSQSAAAKTNALIFRRITPMLKSANIILLIINHITETIDINPMQRKKSQLSFLKQSEALPGGKNPIYLANTIIRVDDCTKLKSTEGFYVDGSITELSLVKSRTSKAGKGVSMVFNQAIGFDADLSLFLLLKEQGLINGAGAYLYIGDRSDMKFAQKNIKDKLASEPEFREVFIGEAIKALTNMVDCEIKDVERNNYNNTAMDIMGKLNGNLGQ